MIKKIYHAINRFFRPQLYWSHSDIAKCRSWADKMYKFINEEKEPYEKTAYVRDFSESKKKFNALINRQW